MFDTYRGKFNMSYTMTLDMPQKEASYVARHRAQFESELSAIALLSRENDTLREMPFVKEVA